jgi:hypothetical protein
MHGIILMARIAKALCRRVGTYRDAPRQSEVATEIHCSNFVDASMIMSA